jgi:hypothetical protein
MGCWVGLFVRQPLLVWYTYIQGLLDPGCFFLGALRAFHLNIL